jgi:hypothetical protein
MDHLLSLHGGAKKSRNRNFQRIGELVQGTERRGGLTERFPEPDNPPRSTPVIPRSSKTRV